MQPAVLIVEDDANLREALFDTLRSDSLPVLTADSGPAALDILDSTPIGLVVSDLQMEPMDGVTLLGKIRELHPTLPAVLMTAYGTIENAVDVMRKGAADYLVKPFEASELKSIVGRYIKATPEGDSLVAADAATVELLQIARRVAGTQVSVTINGPSGCGKEVFARFIHDQSPRCDETFVAINCAAIPETMLEAVLFGYEKGAFTGATGAHAGKFEQATGGTLLLDEISEMDLGLQAKLLRVIQEKEVERIGGRKVIPLDVRILATTNRDLRQLVADGKFREDLYYRLNVFPLHIPALRERRDDILPLAEMAMKRHGNQALTLAPCAREALLAHDWPGNVRELENLIQRTLILLRGSVIHAADLAVEKTDAVGQADGDLNQGLRNREFQLIIDAMTTHGGKRSDVSRALGISPRSLRYKLARMREEGVAIPGERP
ncbi:MAG: sigma-54 dependent transcriptional regulator [Gammaproteobacteria bacterium]|nr:sigma-54 dependent transcriptional regulator [Gammaproteobacteria bacterium]